MKVAALVTVLSAVAIAAPLTPPSDTTALETAVKNTVATKIDDQTAKVSASNPTDAWKGLWASGKKQTPAERHRLLEVAKSRLDEKKKDEAKSKAWTAGVFHKETKPENVAGPAWAGH